MVAQLPVEPERCFDRSIGRSRRAPQETGLTPVDSRGYRILANVIEPAIPDAGAPRYPRGYSDTGHRRRISHSG